MMTGMTDTTAVPPLVAQATRRSLAVWVGVAGAAPRAVWHIWHDGSAYLVTGGLEQALPGAAEGCRAHVIVRSKDRQERVVDWVALVTAVLPGTPAWDEVVPLLHLRRLNAPDGEEQPARWSRESAIWRLTPTGELLTLTPDEGPSYSPVASSST